MPVTAQPGDVRIAGSGAVEMYDGHAWVPYQRFPNVDPGPLLRGGTNVTDTSDGENLS